jgi:uncharacterized membrane protein
MTKKFFWSIVIGLLIANISIDAFIDLSFGDHKIYWIGNSIFTLTSLSIFIFIGYKAFFSKKKENSIT